MNAIGRVRSALGRFFLRLALWLEPNLPTAEAGLQNRVAELELEVCRWRERSEVTTKLAREWQARATKGRPPRHVQVIVGE